MFGLKVVLLLSVAIAAVTATNYPVFGGVTNLSGDSLKAAEATLQNSLTKLAAGEGPNYKISKIHSATYQVVAGSKNTYNVDLIDSNNEVKNCNIDIWSKPQRGPNNVEVTFECQGEAKLVKKHTA